MKNVAALFIIALTFFGCGQESYHVGDYKGASIFLNHKACKLTKLDSMDKARFGIDTLLEMIGQTGLPSPFELWFVDQVEIDYGWGKSPGRQKSACYTSRRTLEKKALVLCDSIHYDVSFDWRPYLVAHESYHHYLYKVGGNADGAHTSPVWIQLCKYFYGE